MTRMATPALFRSIKASTYRWSLHRPEGDVDSLAFVGDEDQEGRPTVFMSRVAEPLGGPGQPRGSEQAHQDQTRQ